MATPDDQEEREYFSRVQRHFSLFRKRNISLLDQVRTAARGLPRSTYWYQQQIRELARGKPASPFDLYRDERSSHKKRPVVGRMYYFFYNPKHRKTLPYYDRFPLIIPIEYYNDGMLGINFHYLRPKTRILLMDKLIDLASDNRMDARTKLRVSYEILSKVSRYPEIQPMLKRYLYSHVKSQFILVEPEDWVTAMLLPVEQFQKETKATVWKESADIIREKRSQSRARKRSTTARRSTGRTRRS